MFGDRRKESLLAQNLPPDVNQKLFQPEQRTIPIVSDEHGILHFGDPFEQNETTQEQSATDKFQQMEELPLSADFYQEMHVELSQLLLSQPQAVGTLSTDEDAEPKLPTGLSQPACTLMYPAEVDVANPEAQMQDVPFPLSQEPAGMDANTESIDTDLGTLLGYGDLGTTSLDDINVEPLSADTNMESLLSDTHLFDNALMRDVKCQSSASDFTKKRDKNIACVTFSGLAYDQSFACDWSNSGRSVVLLGNFKHSFANLTGQKKFSCDICPTQFPTFRAYKTQKRIDTGKKPFQCDICSKKFGTSSDYQTHQQTHTGEKSFQCDICTKQFGTSRSYRIHQRIHTGEKTFQCDICSKQFRTSSEYRKHRRIHTGEKPFQCDICSKKFGTSSDCQRHRRIHTGEKPFQCDTCTKQFRTSSDYKTHRRAHTGEKPFQCDICPKQFGTSGSYRRHRRIHTGEKPFNCDFCQKKFSDRSSYRTHQRKHANEMSYICHWCNHDCSSKRSLIEHVGKCPSRNVSYAADPVVSFFISSGTRMWTYMQ